MPVAVNCSNCVVFRAMNGLAGLTVIETKAGVTLICAVALIVPTEAVIVVVPAPNALTIPALPAALLTLATDGDEEVHMSG